MHDQTQPLLFEISKKTKENVFPEKGEAMKPSTKKTAVKSLTDATQEQKKKAIETAIAQIEKGYGKGAVMKLGDTANMNVSAVYLTALLIP